jgi:hypothetical protein
VWQIEKSARLTWKSTDPPSHILQLASASASFPVIRNRGGIRYPTKNVHGQFRDKRNMEVSAECPTWPFEGFPSSMSPLVGTAYYYSRKYVGKSIQKTESSASRFAENGRMGLAQACTSRLHGGTAMYKYGTVYIRYGAALAAPFRTCIVYSAGDVSMNAQVPTRSTKYSYNYLSVPSTTCTTHIRSK